MKFLEFQSLLHSVERPVVLLEGRRKIAQSDYKLAERFGRMLATRFPRAIFRSGNADGSDQAFSDGVVAVDAARLRIVALYAAHRRKSRYPDATYDFPSDLARLREESIREATIAATPRNKDIFAGSASAGSCREGPLPNSRHDESNGLFGKQSGSDRRLLHRGPDGYRGGWHGSHNPRLPSRRSAGGFPECLELLVHRTPERDQQDEIGGSFRPLSFLCSRHFTGFL